MSEYALCGSKYAFLRALPEKQFSCLAGNREWFMNTSCDQCLASIVQSAPAPVAVVTRGAILYASRRFADLLNMPPERIAGSTPGALLPGIGLEGLIPDSIRTNRPHSMERLVTLGERQASLWAQSIPVSTLPDERGHRAATGPRGQEPSARRLSTL